MRIAQKKRAIANNWGNLSRFGKYKMIAWHPERKVYLHWSCERDASSRHDSWVGTKEQFHNMKEKFPHAEGFIILRDGEERGDFISYE